MPAQRLPSFQFYPGDWLKDPALRSVSLAARGLWADLLCLMSESENRGHLQDGNGSPYSNKQLARMTGANSNQIKKLINELESSNVFSRTDDRGVIYSRRMVQDELKRKTNKENGEKGGSPFFKKSVNPPVNQTGNRNPTPSSSSSSSTSYSKQPPPPTNQQVTAQQAEQKPDDFQPDWGMVGDRLREYGLARVTDAIAEAKAAGFSIPQIIAWLDWLNDDNHPQRKAKIGAGAILERIRTADAIHWNADFGWPPIEDATIKQSAVGPYPVVASEELSKQEAEELGELENDYGQKLNELSDEGIVKLVGPSRSTVNPNFQRANLARRLELLRKLNLEQLRKREAEEAGTIPRTNLAGPIDSQNVAEVDQNSHDVTSEVVPTKDTAAMVRGERARLLTTPHGKTLAVATK